MLDPEKHFTTDITVADIQLTLQIIDACAKRGAFRPAEFSAIGYLVKKLTVTISQSDETKTEEQLEFDL